jgi:hypothetical protein
MNQLDAQGFTEPDILILRCMLTAAIGRLIDLFTPQQCANFFAAAGYDAT